MGAFARIAKRTVLRAGKTHAERDQFFHSVARIFDHATHGERIVFEMPRAHGILEITAVVRLVAEHADPALRKKRIALAKPPFTDDENAFMGGKMRGAIQPRHSRADHEYVVIRVFPHCLHSASAKEPRSFPRLFVSHKV